MLDSPSRSLIVSSVSMRRLPGASAASMSCLATLGWRAPFVDGGADEAADEILLTGDAAVVGRRVLLEAGAVVVLEVAASGRRRPRRPRRGSRGRPGRRRSRCCRPGRVLERHLHTTEHVDQPLERTEAGLHVVVDVNPEVALDRVAASAGGRVVTVEGRVDLSLVVGLGDLDPQVAGNDRIAAWFCSGSTRTTMMVSGRLPAAGPKSAGVAAVGVDAARWGRSRVSRCRPRGSCAFGSTDGSDDVTVDPDEPGRAGRAVAEIEIGAADVDSLDGAQAVVGEPHEEGADDARHHEYAVEREQRPLRPRAPPGWLGGGRTRRQTTEPRRVSAACGAVRYRRSACSPCRRSVGSSDC